MRVKAGAEPVAEDYQAAAFARGQARGRHGWVCDLSLLCDCGIPVSAVRRPRLGAFRDRVAL
jgi:hypothetical protein